MWVTSYMSGSKIEEGVVREVSEEEIESCIALLELIS